MMDTQVDVPLPKPVEPPPRLRLEYLDGVRGLAALFVVFHHTWQGPFGRTAHVGLAGWLTNWALYGHLAVDVFIVLSGFCLSLPVVQSGCIKGGAKGFYKRRAHRILTPYYFAVLLSLPVNFLTHEIGNHPLASIEAVLANLFLLQDWFPNLNVLDGPLWSVAVEWKIYFLFPLFVSIWRRFGMTWTLFVAAFIGYSATLVFHILQPSLAMGNTCPWYVFLFAMGISAGVIAVNGAQIIPPLKLRWVLLTSLLVLTYLLAEFPITTQGEEALYVPHLLLIDPAVGLFAATTLLLLHRCYENDKNFWLLQLTSWQPLVFVGTFAYSIYLIHLPLLWIMAGGTHRIPILKSSLALTALFLFLVVIPSIVCLARVFYLGCEKPFLNGIKHLQTRAGSENQNEAEAKT